LIICLVGVVSCDSSQNKNITGNDNKVIFQPTFHNTPIHCDSSFTHSNNEWHYTQLQFFISAIEFKHKSSKLWHSAPLLKSPYQTSSIALLGENCDYPKRGNKSNWLLTFKKRINLIEVSHIRFMVGLPFSVNHLNPLTQESPLNMPSMFWGWQKGHKFIRFEIASNNDNWLFHLGSVGCKAPSPLRQPKQECRYPNRFTYELPLSEQSNKINVELPALMKNIVLKQGNSCQSSPDNISCHLLFNNLNKTGNKSIFQTTIIDKIRSKNEVDR
jgi:uncharacterized repeat protein (TIGR04052 family)